MRIFKRVICFVLIIGSLFSCMKKRDIENVKTITYYARATTDQLVIWEKVIGIFMKENPDINVRIENVPYQEYWSKLLTMAAGGMAPDVIFMESTRLPAFVTKDNLLSLDEYVKKDKDINLNDFYPVSLQMSKYNKKLYGLPNDLAILAVYYNKNAFDKQGLPYPKSTWTWDDFIKIGKVLTLDKNEDGTSDQYGITHYPWDAAVYQSGGEIVDNFLAPKRSTFNTTRVIEALNFCRDLSYKNKISPPAGQQRYRNIYEMFTSGYAAMTVDGHWMVPKYRKIKKFKWDVVELPRGRKSAGVAYGSCYSIPKGSKNPEAAWRLIKYLSGYKGQEILVSDGFSVPALKKIANSKIYLNSPPDNQKAFLNMIKIGHLNVKSPDYMQIDDIWRNQLDSFWIGKVSAKEAAKRIDEFVDKILQK